MQFLNYINSKTFIIRHSFKNQIFYPPLFRKVYAQNEILNRYGDIRQISTNVWELENDSVKIFAIEESEDKIIYSEEEVMFSISIESSSSNKKQTLIHGCISVC